eukprot:gene4632-8205_t
MKRKREQNNCDWTLKYKLKINELSITKKKVNLVSEAFKDILKNDSCMILAGHSGCGKTTLIQALAEENKVNLKFCESSKYEDFKSFLIKSTKYKSLSIISNQNVQKKDVVVIKSLPVVSKEKHQERNNLILSIIKTSRIPIIILHTIYNSPTLESSLYRELPKDLIQSTKIPTIELKPFTTNMITKRLTKILQEEKKENFSLKWSDSAIEEIAEKSNGDMRCAINQTNLYCFGHKKKKLDEKDNYVNIHHGAARILYAKRDTTGKLEKRNIINTVHTKEDILISYVHHNSLTFCDDIDDVSNFFDDFSESDLYFSKFDNYEEHLSKYGYDIGSMGYCFKNKHQTKQSFKQIRAPLIKQTFFETRDNQQKIKSLFKDELSFNTLVQEKIPFYKRLNTSNILKNEQSNFLKTFQNFQLRNGKFQYTVIKSGKDELEDEEDSQSSLRFFFSKLKEKVKDYAKEALGKAASKVVVSAVRKKIVNEGELTDLVLFDLTKILAESKDFENYFGELREPIIPPLGRSLYLYKARERYNEKID